MGSNFSSKDISGLSKFLVGSVVLLAGVWYNHKRVALGSPDDSPEPALKSYDDFEEYSTQPGDDDYSVEEDNHCEQAYKTIVSILVDSGVDEEVANLQLYGLSIMIQPRARVFEHFIKRKDALVPAFKKYAKAVEEQRNQDDPMNYVIQAAVEFHKECGVRLTKNAFSPHIGIKEE